MIEPSRPRGVPRCSTVLLVVALGCGSGHSPITELDGDGRPTAQQRNRAHGSFRFPEIVGGGGALSDLDADGDLDLVLVHHAAPGDSSSEGDLIYLNHLEDGRPSFEAAAVLATEPYRDPTAFGMGVAIGDIDSDQRPDILVTRHGHNSIYLQRDTPEGPTFRDASAAILEPAPTSPSWSTSASFLDYDRDGRLDLFVAAYVDSRPDDHKQCVDQTGQRDYCGPLAYPALTDRLYRNVAHDGEPGFRLVEVGHRMPIGAAPGPALGTLVHDFDGDGWPDILVANDQAPNHLWMNRPAPDLPGGRTFVDEALERGVAVDATGRPEASMGIALGDTDRDGELDLLMSHLQGETNTLFRSLGSGVFAASLDGSGLAGPSRPMTGFGTAFADFDLDGWLDLFVANGEVRTIPSLRSAGDPFPFHQRNQLYLGSADGFSDVSSEIPALDRSQVSRGLAVGDLDNDGDPDLLVVNNGGPPQMLISEAPRGNRWIGLELAGTGGAVLRATVDVRQADGIVRRFRAGTDGSYLTASDPRLQIGLGADASPVDVQVHWLENRPFSERFLGLASGQYHSLSKGSGQRAPLDPEGPKP